MTTRKRLKAAAGELLWPISNRRVTERLGATTGLILMFHYINAPLLPGVAEDLYVSPEEFDSILIFLKEELHVMPPLAFLAALSAGNLPRRAAMLTFDDGQRDNVENALPALVRHDLQAIFFVCPGLIEAARCLPTVELSFLCKMAPAGRYDVTFNGGDGLAAAAFHLDLSSPSGRRNAYALLSQTTNRMNSRFHEPFLLHLRESLGIHEPVPHAYRLATYEELDELISAGMVVGSHTHFHSTISADGPEQFAADVGRASAELATHLPQSGQRVFCYPWGRPQDITPESAAILGQLGYDYALATQGGLAQMPPQSPLELYREQVSYSLQAAKVVPLVAAWRHRRRYS